MNESAVIKYLIYRYKFLYKISQLFCYPYALKPFIWLSHSLAGNAAIRIVVKQLSTEKLVLSLQLMHGYKTFVIKQQDDTGLKMVTFVVGCNV